MEQADRLYGITMQEKGVSAMVSVDLISDDEIS
jgi:chromosome segregation protein